MGRFYVYESCPLAVVVELRRLGHDVITNQETGRAEQRTPDVDVPRYPIADLRAVLTLNRRHFIRLQNERPELCGIVVRTVDRDFCGQASHFSRGLSIAHKA